MESQNYVSLRYISSQSLFSATHRRDKNAKLIPFETSSIPKKMPSREVAGCGKSKKSMIASANDSKPDKKVGIKNKPTSLCNFLMAKANKIRVMPLIKKKQATMTAKATDPCRGFINKYMPISKTNNPRNINHFGEPKSSNKYRNNNTPANCTLPTITNSQAINCSRIMVAPIGLINANTPHNIEMIPMIRVKFCAFMMVSLVN